MPINLQGSGPITEGWGAAPTLSGSNLGALADAILKNRLLQQKMTGENIADTIKNVRGDMQGDALLAAMKSSKLIPPDYDAGGAGGAAGGTNLARLLMAKQEEDRRTAEAQTYPTQIGDEKYPLTQEQRVRLAIAAQSARAKAQDKTDIWGPKEWDPDLGWVQRNTHTGQVRNFQAFTNPNVQAQKEQSKEDVQRQKVIANLGKLSLTEEDLLEPREYGTAQPVPGDRTGTMGRNFQATKPGVAEQPWVRIRTKSGGTVVIPRKTYEYFRNEIHGPEIPGVDPQASPPPPGGGTVAPGTQGGAPINTPDPNASPGPSSTPAVGPAPPTMPPGSKPSGTGTWIVPGPGGHHYEVDPQTRQTIKQVD